MRLGSTKAPPGAAAAALPTHPPTCSAAKAPWPHAARAAQGRVPPLQTASTGRGARTRNTFAARVCAGVGVLQASCGDSCWGSHQRRWQELCEGAHRLSMCVGGGGGAGGCGRVCAARAAYASPDHARSSCALPTAMRSTCSCSCRSTRAKTWQCAAHAWDLAAAHALAAARGGAGCCCQGGVSGWLCRARRW